MTIEDFFANGGVSTFTDKMCSFLNISTDRMKVVGVYSGSVIIDFYLTSELPGDDSKLTEPNQEFDTVSLNLLAEKIVTGSASGNINLGPGMGPIMSSNYSINIINVDGTPYDSYSNN